VSVSLSVDGPGDAELISAVRGGDIDAYGELFARHVDSARRLARQLAGPADADDLVSDAFTKVLTVLQRGGGPDLAFRAYLLTAVRRLHVDKIRAGSRLRPVDDLTPFDPGLPFQDTAVEGFESAAAARAFATLPERWQMVLWHTEVEQQKPADIAPLLGMSANSVSALAYRAREGLRQAFLSQHATDPDDVDCAWTRDHMGAYVRAGLSRRDAAKVDDHLAACRACAAVYLELTEVNSGLAGLLAPLLLGTAGGVYLSSTGGGAAGGAAGGAGGAASSAASGAAGGSAGAAGGAAGGAGASGLAAVQGFAVAHLGLTVVGGLAVAATAVAAVYGASQLRGHDANNVGSPPTLHHGTSGPDTRTGTDGRQAGNPRQAPTAGQSPNVVLSSLPITPSTGPSTDPSTNQSTGPTQPTTDPTTTPTDPTTTPTDPTTTGPSDPGGGDVSFTSKPPVDPVFGDTYDVSASGRHVVFSLDPATTNNACTLADHTVTFRHAGDCVIAADRGASRTITHSTQKIAVPQGRQVITFRLPGSAQVGDRLPLTATGGASGNPVTFSGNDACTVDDTGTSLTMRHAAGCVVTAHQRGDDDYRDAPDSQATVQVGKGEQKVTITSTAPAAPTFGQAYRVTATSDSGAPVTLAVDPSSNDLGKACSLTGSTVTFDHAGSCAITAQAGNDDYLPATDTQNVDVAKEAQKVTITSTAPAAPTFGQPYSVTATSDSGAPVTLAVDPSSNDLGKACSLTGSTVTFDHAGSCAITAQAGNDDYLPATDTQNVDVPQESQSITFTSTAPTEAEVGGHGYTVTATGGASGNDVTFSPGTPDVCQVTPTGNVTFQHVGTCVIDADQAGNDDYTAAATAHQTIKLSPSDQTITFTSSPPAAPRLTGTYDVSAVSSSGLPVTFSVDSTTTHRACTVSGSTVTFGHSGRCVINADQAGDGDYHAAPTVQQIVIVPLADQAITFTSTAPTDAVVGGDDYTVTATRGGSGQPVEFGSTTHDVCSVSGSSVKFVGTGTCTITADQPGNDDYNRAPTVTQDLTVGADLSVEPKQGLFPNSVVATVRGLPTGKSTTLTVSSDPKVSGLTLGSNCVRLGDLGTCTVTSDPQVFLFAVPPPDGGPTTLTFTVAPVPGVTDPDLSDNTRSFVFRP
jgi:RNA polymerase sigma factor (sigma-70 family)